VGLGAEPPAAPVYATGPKSTRKSKRGVVIGCTFLVWPSIQGLLTQKTKKDVEKIKIRLKELSSTTANCNQSFCITRNEQ